MQKQMRSKLFTWLTKLHCYKHKVINNVIRFARQKIRRDLICYSSLSLSLSLYIYIYIYIYRRGRGGGRQLRKTREELVSMYYFWITSGLKKN